MHTILFVSTIICHRKLKRCKAFDKSEGKKRVYINHETYKIG